MENQSRRSFLTNAAKAGLGFSWVGLLAGCKRTPPSEAVQDADILKMYRCFKKAQKLFAGTLSGGIDYSLGKMFDERVRAYFVCTVLNRVEENSKTELIGTTKDQMRQKLMEGHGGEWPAKTISNLTDSIDAVEIYRDLPENKKFFEGILLNPNAQSFEDQVEKHLVAKGLLRLNDMGLVIDEEPQTAVTSNYEPRTTSGRPSGR